MYQTHNPLIPAILLDVPALTAIYNFNNNDDMFENFSYFLALCRVCQSI